MSHNPQSKSSQTGVHPRLSKSTQARRSQAFHLPRRRLLITALTLSCTQLGPPRYPAHTVKATGGRCQQKGTTFSL